MGRGLGSGWPTQGKDCLVYPMPEVGSEPQGLIHLFASKLSTTPNKGDSQNFFSLLTNFPIKRFR